MIRSQLSGIIFTRFWGISTNFSQINIKGFLLHAIQWSITLRFGGGVNLFNQHFCFSLQNILLCVSLFSVGCIINLFLVFSLCVFINLLPIPLFQPFYQWIYQFQSVCMSLLTPQFLSYLCLCYCLFVFINSILFHCF